MVGRYHEVAGRRPWALRDSVRAGVARPARWPGACTIRRPDGPGGRADASRWEAKAGSRSTTRVSPGPSLPPKLQQVGGVDAARGQQRAQLANAGGLDLPHALAAQREPLADRLQRLRWIALEAEATSQDGPLVGRKVVEHGDQLTAILKQRHEGIRRMRRAVRDHVAERRLPLLAH